MAKSIAVAGKGGTGKSTIAALIISRMINTGKKPVLAIDADPDCNLGTLLGLETVKSIGELREEVRAEIKNFPPGMTKASYVEAGLHEIIAETKGFDLITMGRGEGSGCYCYLNSLIKKFSDDLTPTYPWMVMDNEAGLEHISRRTSANIDLFLIIVTDNPLSLNSAEKIKELTDTLKPRIENTYAVTNMLEGKKLNRVMERLKKINIPVLCSMPYDSELDEAIFNGDSLFQFHSSPVFEQIDIILDKLGGKDGNT